MSLGQFAKGLGQGLPAGIEFAEEMDRQGEVKAQQEAGDILAQMQAFDPFANVSDATVQGIAEPGQTTLKNPNQGFSGTDFNSLESKFYKAAGKLSDPRSYALTMEAYGTMKMNRINEMLDAGIMAYDNGDTATASRMMRGASAFISPGTTPEITVDPQSGAFLVANYDDKGNPKGGYAITRDQLMDFRGRNTDYNAWATREQREQEHKDQMSLQRARFAASVKASNARAALASSREQRLAEKTAVEIAGLKLENDLKRMELVQGYSTFNSKVAADNATNLNTTATQNAAAMKAARTSESDIDRTNAENKQAETTAVLGTDAALRTHESGVAATDATNRATAAENDKKAEDIEDSWGRDELMDLITYDPKHAEKAQVQPAPGAIPAGEEDALDAFDDLLVDTGKADKTASGNMIDPMYMVENDDGTVTPQPATMAGMDAMMKDLRATNPDIDKKTAAMVTEGTFGRSQSTDIVYDEDTGLPYLRTPLGSFNVSPGMAAAAENWRDTMSRVLDEFSRRGGVPPETPQPGALAGSPSPIGAAPAVPGVSGVPMVSTRALPEDVYPGAINTTTPAPPQVQGIDDTAVFATPARRPSTTPVLGMGGRQPTESRSMPTRSEAQPSAGPTLRDVGDEVRGAIEPPGNAAKDYLRRVLNNIRERGNRQPTVTNQRWADPAYPRPQVLE